MTESLPMQIEFAISFEAMSLNMSTDEYIRNLRAIIDAAYGESSTAPATASMAFHLQEIRQSFMRKPTVAEYFLWRSARSCLAA